MTSLLLERLPTLGDKVIDGDDVLDRFLDYTAAIDLELYPAQEEALLEVMAGKNLILNTPTGSGKSLVAQAQHFLAMCRDERSVYTSPIKALVNEKFFELCRLFHPDNVGLMTGDATVNRDAPIICCTAEILANWALREGDKTDVQHVIMDEFHYYADRDRGVAWQLPLLTLPQASFLLMSATLGETAFFEEAMTQRNGRPSVTVSSKERPVPLDFHYAETPLHETIELLVEKNKAPIYVVSFTQRNCHDVAQNLTSIKLCDREHRARIGAALDGTRFDSPYGKILARFLRHGIGVHHGGMLPKYRRCVERLAQQGLLRVISGTDTLGVGVNVPIRTVLLTKLCKFDGRNMRILRVRDFHQICGRAGRKGFDDAGSVVVQAPEHVIENLKLEAKAATQPNRRKKIVKKKPPERGYTHYDRKTFEGLVSGSPESLESRFRVSHGMLLNVLGRSEGGCHAMKQLLRDCHDRKGLRKRHRKTAMQLFRSLVQAKVITFVDNPNKPGTKQVEVDRTLQKEFSLHHVLSLFAVETIDKLNRDVDSYALDVLSVIEAILEDPTILLRKQLDRIKTVAVAEMKAEGLDYDERMEKLDQLEHPKPNKDFLYGAFNSYSAEHPWVGGDNIRPKGVIRELYEGCYDFQGFELEYKLERSEGSLLRYLSQVYRAVVQTVPPRARNEEVDDLIDYLGSIVRGVDASLIDEWEQLRDPNYVPVPQQDLVDKVGPERPQGITANDKTFTVLVRNSVFAVVRALAQRDYKKLAQLCDGPEGEIDAAAIEERMDIYFAQHQSIRLDPRARGTRLTQIDKTSPTQWIVSQTLCDPEDHNDWVLELRVDLSRSNSEARPVLQLDAIAGT